MLLGGQGVSVYDNVEGLNDSEPEEGRERDKNHHLTKNTPSTTKRFPQSVRPLDQLKGH